MNTADLFVAGGGPAGLVAALAARRKGLRVVVADPSRPPIDKACGEGLMPVALDSLAKLGVNLSPHDGSPFRGIRFVGHGSSVDAHFPQDAGLGIARPHLHAILVEHALAAGVELLWNTPVSHFEPNSVQCGESRVVFRYLAGADGGNSNVRRWANLHRRARDGVRFGFRRHYRVAEASDHVEVHWAADRQIYITPVAPDRVGVAVLVRDKLQRLDDSLQFFPDIKKRLGPPVDFERGAPSVTRRLRRVVKENVALVGDASGSVDAITGDGLSLSFRQGIALAQALADDRLERYQQAHEQIRQGPARMASLLLLMDRSPMLCRRALRVLAARPDLFASMLAVHAGEPSPARFFSALCSLGWSFLTPESRL